jgi:hypothetical protein
LKDNAQTLSFVNYIRRYELLLLKKTTLTWRKDFDFVPGQDERFHVLPPLDVVADLHNLGSI